LLYGQGVLDVFDLRLLKLYSSAIENVVFIGVEVVHRGRVALDFDFNGFDARLDKEASLARIHLNVVLSERQLEGVSVLGLEEARCDDVFF